MNKKFIIPSVIVGLLLIGGIVYLAISLNNQKQANKDMQELAELDKKEMENEYQMFADQYSELKTQINNDSIIEQLTQEQLKTEKLLEELKNVKASDAREIARLKTRNMPRRHTQLCARNRLAQPPQPEPHGGKHPSKRTVRRGHEANTRT